VTILNDQREAMKKAYRVCWRRYVDQTMLLLAEWTLVFTARQSFV
jgi:hypothetical protein